MRLPLLAILALSVSCSQMSSHRTPSSEEDEQPIPADCYRDICNGDVVFDYTQGKINGSHGIISDITLNRWAPMGGEGIMVPEAKLQLENGKLLPRADVRYLVKYPLESRCANVGDVKFCPNDKVIVIPNHSNGYSDIAHTKILAILPPSMAGSTDRILTVDPSDETKYVSGQMLGIGEEGKCFDREHGLCIGDSYDNGLGSQDKIQGYFPLNDVFSISAGDIGKSRTVFRKELIARKKGNYRVVKTINQKSYKHGSISGKKNESAARESALKEAQKQCSYEFLGQGTLDPNEKNKPEVKNCDRELKGGGIVTHGGAYGPSIMVTCDVKFEYACVHKKKLK